MESLLEADVLSSEPLVPWAYGLMDLWSSEPLICACC